MSKTYRINFSPDSEVVIVKERNKSGDIVDMDIKTSKIEKVILEELTRSAIKEMKVMGNITLAVDFLKQIENAKDFIDLDTIDFKNVENGLKTIEKFDIWFKCDKLWQQLAKKEEYKQDAE